MDLHEIMKGLINFTRATSESNSFTGIYVRNINPKFMIKIVSNDSLHIKLFIGNAISELNQVWELEPGILELPVKNLGINFNHKEFKISKLPDNLENLMIESLSFNDYLDNLPSTLKSLTINAFNFNMDLDNLPLELENLKIMSSYYDKPLDNLPIGLKTLFIGRLGISSSLDNLPQLIELEIDAGNTQYKLNNLPKTLRKLVIGQLMHSLEGVNFPESITRLEIREYFVGKYPLCNFPKNLKILTLGRKRITRDFDFNIPLVNLPDIEELTITDPNYDHDLCHLPRSIKVIRIDKFFWLPNQATTLYKRALAFRRVMSEKGIFIEIKELLS